MTCHPEAACCISHGQLHSATAFHIAEPNRKWYTKHQLKHWVMRILLKGRSVLEAAAAAAVLAVLESSMNQ
jgi:hypothetical protein